VIDRDQAPPRRERDTSPWFAFNVIVRLLAIALLAWLVPVAGLIALGAIVVLWLFRARIDLTTILVLYVVALWIIPSRYTVGAFAVTAAMLFGFAALVLWVFGKALPDSRFARGPSPTNRAILVFLFVTLVDIAIVAMRPLQSIDQRSIDRNFAILVALCGLAVAITDGIRSGRRLDRILGAVVVCAGIVAIIGFIQYFAHFDVPRYLHPPGFKSTGQEAFTYHRNRFTRVAGTALHPIEFGVALAASLPLALHYATYARNEATRLGSRIAFLLILGAIPITLSRSAVIATGLVALILLPTWTPGRRWRVILTFLVSLLLIGALFPGVYTALGSLFTGGKVGAGSLQTRSDATSVAFTLIGHSPIMGNGFAVSTESPIIVDNQYLVTMIETGLIGLAALLGLIFSGIGAARRSRRNSTDPATRDLAQSLFAMIAAVAIGGFGLNILRFPITAGLLFIGIGSAGALLRMTSRTANVAASEGHTDYIGASPP
jgi:hypothetical protein